ncbi:hypothetical protein GGI26_004075 [Coemansia sp. RSA 1358]|uniref:Fanconi anemia group I protein n=1 Tax=Coemansia umbellata TaxID=1424467 RepID=A0ABQ8PIU6_9FUNG|nr:hypothetical protein EDC05_004332 [Coemansia umbellata]KAJ2621495.1 hypothetical protein GGI26_004075 [Coemansia sp. RSA 1358]
MNPESISTLLQKITSLGRERAFAALGQLLGEQDEGTLYAMVETDLGASSEEYTTSTGFSATLFMFKGASALIERGNGAGQSKLGTIASACVAQVCDDPKEEYEGSSQKWAAICDKLLEVLPQLSPRAVIDISFRILAELKTCGSTPNSFHGFLPMLLDTLGAIGQVEIVSKGFALGAASSQNNGSNSSSVTRTGSELKSYWVDSACAYRWDPKASVAVCALLREIVLSERQVQSVAKRMLRQLKLVELTELPSMVYQLLLFTRKGFKQEIIAGIFESFDMLEDESIQPANADKSNSDQQQQRKKWRELGDIEGTVMLHINYSIKQDFELGNALIAYAKEKSELAVTAGDSTLVHGISTFSFACLLSLACIHRFEETVTGLLRTAIVKGIHDRILLSSVIWARPYLPTIAFDADKLLKSTVARASFGWEQVMQSLLRLCLNLIDYTAMSAKRAVYSHQACAEAQRICMEALRAAFAAHEFVRIELIDQILSHITFQTDSHKQFLALLRDLVSDNPAVFHDYHTKFVEVFDSISVISPSTIEQLLLATSPILLEEAQFRKSLLLVLRKILFTHSIEERRTALSGLFVLAKCFVTALDDCHSQLAAANNALAPTTAMARQLQARVDTLMTVLLEVLGLLRRCFTQQPEIRAMSYRKLALALDTPCIRRNLFFLNALSEIMRIEFAKYYQGNSAYDSPINIIQCVNPSTHKIIMPISSFLQCFAKLSICLSDIDNGLNASNGEELIAADSSSGFSHDAQNMWKDLCLRFSKIQIEDFELDPTGDYSISDPVGLRNYNTALMVAGCLDVLIEYTIMHCIRSESCGDCRQRTCDLGDPALAMTLFSKFARIGDVLCSLCLDDKKKRLVGSISDLSLLSLSSLVNILQLVMPDKQRISNEIHSLNADDAWGNHAWFISNADRASAWSGNQAFVKHLLEITLARVLRRITVANNINFASTESLSAAPEIENVLKIAYIVYSGVFSYYANASSGHDIQLPSYLKGRNTRGRSVSQLSAELLLACGSILSSKAKTDHLALAALRPNSDVFNAQGEPNIAATCEATSTLLVCLRSVVDLFLTQKPVLVKESVSLLLLINLLSERLTLLAVSPGIEEPVQTQVYRCVNSTAGWGLRLVFGEIPGDINLLKSLFAVISTSQPFLQCKESAFAPSVKITRDLLKDLTLPALSKDPDCEELAPTIQIVATICNASRLLLEDAPDDHEEEDPNLEVYTLRTIPALIGAIITWFKAELRQIDWVIGQLKRLVKFELLLRPMHDTEDLHVSIHVERRICRRLHSLAELLDQLLSIQFSGKVSGDLVIRCLQDMHKTFAQLTRAKLSQTELPISESYIETLTLVCTNLNSRAYAILVEKYGSVADDQASQNTKGIIGDKKKDKGKSIKVKSKMHRDSALVSSLVYQIELTEKYVIQLSTKFKTPLAHYLKRSTARDFRIETSAIPDLTIMEEESGMESESESAIDGHVGQPREYYQVESNGEAEDVDVSEGDSEPETEAIDMLDVAADDDDEDKDEDEDEGEDEDEDRPQKSQQKRPRWR